MSEALSIGGVRLCPVCEAPDEIAAGDALWPAGWVCPACGSPVATAGGITRLARELDGTQTGFDPIAHTQLATVEHNHFWFEERNTLISWLLQRYCGQARRVLEIGCGTGFVLQTIRKTLREALIAGSELHSEGLVVAMARHGNAVELIQMDARRIGLRDAVDVVGAFDVLEHIPDDEVVLAEIAQALRPNGLLVLSVPQHPWLWSESDDLAHHVRRYKRGEMEEKLRQKDFEILFSDSFVCLLLPLMVIARATQRLRKSSAPMSNQEALDREFRLPPSTNAILRLVLKFEHVLRRAGLRYPVGGSRVIVSRRRATRPDGTGA